MTAVAAMALQPDTDYRPEHDPAFFDDVAGDLLEHLGEWRHSGRIVLEMRGGYCDSADLARATGRVVEELRRIGLVISGDRELGYRLVGIRRVRWVKSQTVLIWPPKKCDGERARQLPGQLTLVPDDE